MREAAWWHIAIFPLVGVAMVAIVTVIMGWLERSRLKPRVDTDARRLRHPISTLIAGAVSFTLFAAIAVAALLRPNETTTWWTTTFFVGSALLSLSLITLYFTDKHEVSESGLAFTTIVGVRKSMPWKEIKSLRYVPLLKWFHVEAHSGEVARVSMLLMGLPEFARLALAQVPACAVQPSTLEVLRETADGYPPSAWN